MGLKAIWEMSVHSLGVRDQAFRRRRSARRSHSRDWPGIFGRANLQDMKRIAIVFLAFALVGLAPRDGAPAEATATPTVVELFTSQSCYSRPPAETFLGELAAAGRNGRCPSRATSGASG